MDYTPDVWYAGYSIDLPSRQVVFAENADQSTETASTIKSPIGVLAMMAAYKSWGHDFASRTLTLYDDHVPVDASTLFSAGNRPSSELAAIAPSVNRVDQGWSLSFEDTLLLNIAHSDATASNWLIEFLGGKDEVNPSLPSVGIDDTELLVDKIDFDPIPLSQVDFSARIGQTTMRAMAEYYADLDTTLRRSLGQASVDGFMGYLSATTQARLLSVQKENLPNHLHFANKTGTIYDDLGDTGQLIVVDSGILSISRPTKRKLAVATTLHAARPDLAGINHEFSKLNQVNLGL